MCLPVKDRNGNVGTASDTGEEAELSLSSGLQDLEVSSPTLLCRNVLGDNWCWRSF